MKLLPKCNEVEARLTEYTEGTLSFGDRFGMRLHLLLCHPCAALLRGVRLLPSLGKHLLSPTATAPPEALKALETVRQRIK
ncbi:MAG: zf-HC2 domain-containing protein [Holophaga sp.]|nr:zf-HC2 domain-containing protein [Holophaga sp.]